jgi:hypothetical protein
MTTTPVATFFQWAASYGRLHVARSPTTQQIKIVLPDYDDPEDPEQDYELVFPITTFESAAHFEVAPTDDPHVVTVPLLITDDIVAEIPLVHLPANYVPTGAYLNIQHLPIPCSQITEL